MYSGGLSELVLIVSDVRQAAAFYRDVVGLIPENEATDEWAWFWAGEPGQNQWVAVHKGSLLFEEQSPYPEGERWGHVHFALEVPSERLESAVEHVRAKEVPVYGPVQFKPYGRRPRARAYYFYDPDGNLVEFWSADDASPADGHQEVLGPGHR